MSAAVLLFVLAGASGVSSGQLMGAAPAAGSVGTASSTTFPTPIQHVVYVLLENQPLSAIQADNGYIWSQCASYSCAMDYYSVCHPSSPNYLALTSGQLLQCGSDGYHSYSVSNIGELVDAKGETWASYSQSMPSLCDLSNSGEYAVRHNPMAWYSGVTSDTSYCDSHLLPFPGSNVSGGPSSWASIPNFLFVDPDLLNDGHTPGGSQGIADADAWLKSWLPSMEKESWFSTSVIFVIYDESADSDVTCPSGLTGGISTTDCGGHVYLSAISPYTAGVGAYTTNVDDYDVLTTTEWLLGLGNTGANDAHGVQMKGLFDFSSPPPTTYAVSGWVNDTGGTPISGADVVFSQSGSTVASATSDAAGAYKVQLANGTYAVAVTANGYVAGSGKATVKGSALAGENFVLETPAPSTYTVSGWVNSTSGGNVASAAVSFSSSSASNASTSTSKSGEYQVSLTNGTYHISIAASGYDSQTAKLTVNGKNIAGEDFALSRTSSTIYPVRGWVNDTNGTPLDSATVTFSTPGQANVTAITGSDGTYLADLENGTYTVTAAATGFSSASAALTIKGHGVSSLDFLLSLLPPTTYLVTGNVTGSSSDVPVAGATVSASMNGTVVSTATNNSGGYAFALTNGTYTINVSAPGYASAGTQVVVSGAPIAGIDFGLSLVPPLPSSPNFEVAGSVFWFPASAPVANATVYLNGSGLAETNTTATNGGFAFFASNGTYLLTVVASGLQPGNGSVVVDGDNASGIVLAMYALNLPVYTVSGSVSANGTQPLGEATVAVQVDRTVVAVETAENGSFALRLPNGTYTLVIFAEGFAPTTKAVAVNGQPVANVNLDVPWSAGSNPLGLNSVTQNPVASWGIGIAAGVAFLLVGYIGWWTGKRAAEEDERSDRDE